MCSQSRPGNWPNKTDPALPDQGDKQVSPSYAYANLTPAYLHIYLLPPLMWSCWLERVLISVGQLLERALGKLVGGRTQFTEEIQL